MGRAGTQTAVQQCPTQELCIVGPDAYGRVTGNTTENLPKTGKQHEMEVYRVLTPEVITPIISLTSVCYFHSGQCFAWLAWFNDGLNVDILGSGLEKVSV